MGRYSEGFYTCFTCGKQFPAGWEARDSHCRAKGHQSPWYECETCPRWFNSEHACAQHMEALGHFYDDEDEDEDEDDDEDENEDQAEDEDEDYEYDENDCDDAVVRDGGNSGRRHLPYVEGTIWCPFCPTGFSAASAVVNHLESGGCRYAQDMNRDGLYRLVLSRDPEGIVAKYLGPSYSSEEYEATDRAWNGRAYECYFCHANFRELHSLNQHLNSPTRMSVPCSCSYLAENLKTADADIRREPCRPGDAVPLP